jgi:hypothetical protein
LPPSLVERRKADRRDDQVGAEDFAETVRDGRKLRRRHRMTMLTVAAVGALVVGGAAAAQQTIGTSPQTLRVVPADTPAPRSKVGVVVYYLVDKAERPDGRFRPATQITPRTVTVENTGDPAYDAVHALLTVEPPEVGLSSGFNFIKGDQIETIDVTEIRHQDGVSSPSTSPRTPGTPTRHSTFAAPRTARRSPSSSPTRHRPRWPPTTPSGSGRTATPLRASGSTD